MRRDILVVPTHSIRGSVLDITDIATPGRFRLLDCVQYTHHDTIRLVEIDDLSELTYSAISYVWRGNPLGSWQETRGTFSVKGAEHADPISMDVLYHAAIASIQHQADYIWMDRLCIMQQSRDDKSWQIARMFAVYQSCLQCIVLPGGVQKLVPLDEQTGWIHRAWTLQECLAPSLTLVLFSWNGGASNLDAPYGGWILPVIPAESAVCHLREIVDASYEGSALIYPLADGADKDISGTRHAVSILAPAGSPSLAALGAAMVKQMDTDYNAHAIWKCALIRTSSRPVDMVFSIMGLFGVTLNPKAFRAGDRLEATLVLAQELLRRGHRATWLGASLMLPPAEELSSFPSFPQTSVSGEALIPFEGTLRRVEDMINMDFPTNGAFLEMLLPRGSMDDDGYFAFSARALPLVSYETSSQDGHEVVLTAINNTKWVAAKHETSGILCHKRPSVLAILLGWYDGYMPGMTAKVGNNIKGMLVQEHADERFHVMSYINIDIELLDWVKSWELRELLVGGPKSVHISRNDHSTHLLDDGLSPKRSFLAAREVETRSVHRDWYPGIPRIAESTSKRVLIQFRDSVAAKKHRWIPPTYLLKPRSGVLKYSRNSSYTNSGDIIVPFDAERPTSCTSFKYENPEASTFKPKRTDGPSLDYEVVIEERWYCLFIEHIPHFDHSTFAATGDKLICYLLDWNCFLPRDCISRLRIIENLERPSQASEDTISLHIAFNREEAASVAIKRGVFINGMRYCAPSYTRERPEEWPLHV